MVPTFPGSNPGAPAIPFQMISEKNVPDHRPGPATPASRDCDVDASTGFTVRVRSNSPIFRLSPKCCVSSRFAVQPYRKWNTICTRKTGRGWSQYANLGDLSAAEAAFQPQRCIDRGVTLVLAFMPIRKRRACAYKLMGQPSRGFEGLLERCLRGLECKPPCAVAVCRPLRPGRLRTRVGGLTGRFFAGQHRSFFGAGDLHGNPH